MTVAAARDLAVRVARTFLQAFLGALTAAPLVGLSIPAVKAAALAGLAAVLSLVQGLLYAPERK